MKYSVLVILVFLLLVPFVKAQNVQLWGTDGVQTTRDILPALPIHDNNENQPAYFANFVTQTIALSQGYNTISSYVGVTLDEIKGALLQACGLVDNIKIIAPNGSSSTYQTRNNSWRGNLTEWDATKGLTVYVPNTPTNAFALEGVPLGNIAITIVPGYNLISFTCDMEIPFATALASFEAVDGDKIIAPDGTNASYGGNWRGRLSNENLKPGVGYVIYSASETTRTITLR